MHLHAPLIKSPVRAPWCPTQKQEPAADLQAASNLLTYNPGGSTLNGVAFSNYLVTAHKQSSVTGAAKRRDRDRKGAPSIGLHNRGQPGSLSATPGRSNQS